MNKNFLLLTFISLLLLTRLKNLASDAQRICFKALQHRRGVTFALYIICHSFGYWMEKCWMVAWGMSFHICYTTIYKLFSTNSGCGDLHTCYCSLSWLYREHDNCFYWRYVVWYQPDPVLRKVWFFFCYCLHILSVSFEFRSTGLTIFSLILKVLLRKQKEEFW